MTDLSAPTIRVLAIDPGSGSTGYAVLDYDLNTGHTTVLHHGVWTGARLIKERKEMQTKFSKSFIILDVYYHLFSQMMRTHQPQYVVSEGAFYHRFAQTYASLTLVIHTLRRACHDILDSDIYEVAPMETKKEVAGNHMADKVQIKDALLSRAQLTIVSEATIAIDDLSEHAYDAIAHGLTFITRELPTVLATQACR